MFEPIKVNKIKRKVTVLEKTRQRRILKYLNAVPGCIAEVRTQTGYGIKGGADIFGCINGQHFELEVKQPGARLTDLQQKWLQNWGQCGAIHGRVETIESTRELFRKHGINI